MLFLAFSVMVYIIQRQYWGLETDFGLLPANPSGKLYYLTLLFFLYQIWFKQILKHVIA